jgi:inner membrane protein involved in colicin E2 resistance
VFATLAAVMYLTRRVNWYDTLSRSDGGRTEVTERTVG